MEGLLYLLANSINLEVLIRTALSYPFHSLGKVNESTVIHELPSYPNIGPEVIIPPQPYFQLWLIALSTHLLILVNQVNRGLGYHTVSAKQYQK